MIWGCGADGSREGEAGGDGEEGIGRPEALDHSSRTRRCRKKPSSASDGCAVCHKLCRDLSTDPAVGQEPLVTGSL